MDKDDGNEHQEDTEMNNHSEQDIPRIRIMQNGSVPVDLPTAALEAYINRLNRTIVQMDGYGFGNLMRLADRPPHGIGTVDAIIYLLENPQSYLSVQGFGKDPLWIVVLHHMRAIKLITANDIQKGFEAQCQGLSQLIDFLKESTEQIHCQMIVDALSTLLKDARRWAVTLDKRIVRLQSNIEMASDSASSSSGSNNQESAVQNHICTKEIKKHLDNCFRISSMARGDSTLITKKKLMALLVVNQLFKTYFTLGTLQLCKKLIIGVEQAGFPALQVFPMSQQVTYQYYSGIIALFEDRIDQAHTFLMFAFINCPKRSKKNLKKIVEYLVPLKLLKGYMPSNDLLIEYDLPFFVDIVREIRLGNVRRLSELFDIHQHYLIHLGLFLITDKLKTIAYRNLFRLMTTIFGDMLENKDQKEKIPLQFFIPGFKKYSDPSFKNLESNDTESEESILDEIKCVLSNLIVQGVLKGYLSHAKNTLVLSKKEPFPQLSKAF